MANNEDLGKAVITQLGALKSERDMNNVLWADAYRYTFPSRGQGFINPGQPSGLLRGRAARDDEAMRFDSTLAESAELFAASTISGLVPPNSNWLSLSVDPDVDVDNLEAPDLEQESKDWLQDVSDTMHHRIHKSNFDAEIFDVFLDVTCGGMGGILVEPNEAKDGYTFEYWAQDTMYCAQTVSRESVDTILREVYYTCAQACDKFGDNMLPDNVLDEYTKDPTSQKKFNFVQAVRPRMREGRQLQGVYAKTMPFESVWVEVSTKKVVKESGYRDFPVIVPRYRRIPGTAYAEGPCSTPLADAMTLNQVMEFVLTNTEMMIAGTFVAKPDGRLNENTIVIGARKVVFAANVDNIKPLVKGGDMQIAEWLIDRLERRIRKAMKSDQLEPLEKSGNPISATEARIRIEQIRSLLSPVYARMQAEFLRPFVRRCYNIGIAQGWFGKIPDELSAKKLTPKFSSPLARAAQAEEVQSIQLYEQYLLQQAQVNPAVLDLYDFDGAARKVAEYRGVPLDLIRSEKDVNRNRQDKQNAQAAAQQQQALSSVVAAQASGKSGAYNVG